MVAVDALSAHLWRIGKGRDDLAQKPRGNGSAIVNAYGWLRYTGSSRSARSDRYRRPLPRQVGQGPTVRRPSARFDRSRIGQTGQHGHVVPLLLKKGGKHGPISRASGQNDAQRTRKDQRENGHSVRVQCSRSRWGVTKPAA